MPKGFSTIRRSHALHCAAISAQFSFSPLHTWPRQPHMRSLHSGSGTAPAPRADAQPACSSLAEHGGTVWPGQLRAHGLPAQHVRASRSSRGPPTCGYTEGGSAR